MIEDRKTKDSPSAVVFFQNLPICGHFPVPSSIVTSILALILHFAHGGSYVTDKKTMGIQFLGPSGW